jgi:hypothetical protein
LTYNGTQAYVQDPICCHNSEDVVDGPTLATSGQPNIQAAHHYLIFQIDVENSLTCGVKEYFSHL